jgi:uncharacterized membrane protein
LALCALRIDAVGCFRLRDEANSAGRERPAKEWREAEANAMVKAYLLHLSACAALGAGLAAAPSPARADFRLCNNTNSRVSVALAYTNGASWVSEGWWNIKASACETLLRGPLAAQYYYVYAMDERGGEWKGKAFMCTRDREFRIDGREDCFVRGFDRSGFFEVDTGKDAKNWTVQLTDPGVAR